MRFFIVILFLVALKGVWSQDTLVHIRKILPMSSPMGSDVCLQDYVYSIDYSYVNRKASYDSHQAILPIRANYLVFPEDHQPGNGPGYSRCRELEFKPVSESYASIDSSNNLSYRVSAGVAFRFQRNRWYNKTQFISGWSSRETVDQDHAAFLPNNDHSYYWYNSFRTRTHYTYSDALDVSFGIDNHFIGEGYRSLIQGNQNAPVPFAMMRVNFWRLEYGLLYQFNHENTANSQMWKFNVLHYLSYNITHNFNVTLIEQVLFQPKDGTFNRGFEIEYLNPIVFFRPQEYSLGSTDNVLLGLNTSYKLKQHVIYGQVSLDEFVIDEIRKRSKWWANKYGAQLGIKGTFKGLKYIVEGNVVRPYTYSHINSGQNSGNMGLAVGHPLGSNFAEILTVVTKEHFKSSGNSSTNKFSFSGFAAFQLKGYDPDSLSWGGNIYESYVLRPKEYGNTIGQGKTVRSVLLGGQFAYSNLKWPFEYYAQFGVNYSWGEIKSVFSPSAVIGIRSTLFQTRKMF